MYGYRHTIFLILLLSLTGCTAIPVQQISSRDWVRKESGAYIDAGEKVFYGVGISSGIRNTLLLRSSADNQAQAQVSRVLTGFTNGLANSVAPGPGIGAGVNALVNHAMADAVIVDHWQNKETGQYYALCRLTLETFKSHLATYPAFDQKTRQSMLARADTWYARIVRR